MCRCLFLLLISASFSLSALVPNDKEQHIVRPDIKIHKDDVKNDLVEEKLIPLPRQPKKEEDVSPEDYSSSSSSSEEEKSLPSDELDPAMKDFLKELIRVFSDYEDDADGHEQVLGQKPDDEERPFPRLSIDPPRKPFPNLGQEVKPEETPDSVKIPIPLILVEPLEPRTDNMYGPLEVEVSIDMSHIILIALSAIMLFWCLNKAFSYYYRPRPSVTPVIGDADIVNKIPLP